MILTDEKNCEIFDIFAKLKIYPKRIDEGFLSFNRDQCHISLKLSEFEVIDKINSVLKEISGDEYYIHLSGKTDDDWFCEIYIRNCHGKN